MSRFMSEDPVGLSRRNLCISFVCSCHYYLILYAHVQSFNEFVKNVACTVACPNPRESYTMVSFCHPPSPSLPIFFLSAVEITKSLPSSSIVFSSTFIQFYVPLVYPHLEYHLKSLLIHPFTFPQLCAPFGCKTGFQIPTLHPLYYSTSIFNLLSLATYNWHVFSSSYITTISTVSSPALQLNTLPNYSPVSSYCNELWTSAFSTTV